MSLMCGKNHTRCKSLIFCIFLFNLFVPMTYAKQVDRGIGVYVDQDLLVPLFNEDRDYTMGIAVEFFWAKEEGFYPLDGLVKQASTWLDTEAEDNNIVYSFMIGTLAYTPDDLGDSLPIYNDRPYSSLIYLSNKRMRATNEKAFATEVLLGVLGTRMSGEAQTRFHTAYRSTFGGDEPVNPQGWSHQISDGGEITMRLRLSHSSLESTLSKAGVWDVATTLGAALGFQSNASASVALRAGDIKSPFWSLPFDPVTRGNFLPARAVKEWYFWTAFRAHLIAYDALLQGQFRNSDVTYDSDEIERLIYDGAVGATVGFEESQITLSVNAKSSELKIQDRSQVWGSINYIIHF